MISPTIPLKLEAVEGLSRFDQALANHGLGLRRSKPEILQLNIGKICNLTCVHCHVNAGPARKEIMSGETVDRVLEWLAMVPGIHTVDLTGGAPEMIPDFRRLVVESRKLDKTVIDRCNLTILLEPGYEDLAGFLFENEVEIVASMPCYQPENVNAQRGDGVFDASIAGLQRLNQIGYGTVHGLPLHLVYNPNGANLPGDQNELESDFKRELKKHFGIEFHNLYAITNLPIARFAAYLKRNNQLEDYLALLRDAFNPASVDGLMCRNTINVSWHGEVFDCDFNQMLRMPMGALNNKLEQERKFLWDIDPDELGGAPIATGEHCFGCTAGAGSSCQGAVA